MRPFRMRPLVPILTTISPRPFISRSSRIVSDRFVCLDFVREPVRHRRSRKVRTKNRPLLGGGCSYLKVCERYHAQSRRVVKHGGTIIANFMTNGRGKKFIRVECSRCSSTGQ